MKESRKHRSIRLPLALAAASTIALTAGLAQAQDDQSATQQPANRPARTQLETVVTQATRVATSAQTTPVATTSISGDQLQRTFASDLRDLSSQAPNVNLEPVGAFQNASAFYIRGFGSADIESATDPGVGIFIDGVYQARTSTALTDLLDIDSVEVLRGPQGTLFGRNTIVGAVIVNHAKPDLNDFKLRGTVKAGNYGELDVSAMVNVPLVQDKAALRVAMKSTNNDGFYYNQTDHSNYGGTDRLTFLPSLRVTPNDNLDVVIRGEYVRERDDSWANTPYSECGGTNGVFNPFSTNQYGGPPGDYTQTIPLIEWAYEGQAGLDKVCAQNRGKNDFNQIYADNTSGRGSDFDVWGITGEINYTIPDVGTFTYVGNYRHVHEDVYNDFDTTDLPIFMTQREQWHHQTSHELRFASDFSKRIDFVAGFYYFDQKYLMWQDTYGWLFDPGFGAALGQAIGSRLAGSPDVSGLDALNPNAEGFGQTIQTDRSWAAFINANWHFTDTLTLTAGVRYTKEKKDFYNCAPSPVNDAVNRTCNLNPAVGNFFSSDTDIAAGRNNSWSNVSPKVGVSWQPSDELFMYASWTRGFRSGGFNGRCGSTATCQPYNPETADSYEVGIKWDGLDNRLRVNLTGFWIEYSNQQVAIIRQSSGSGGGQETVTDNAASARSRGIELEIKSVPADGLSLWGSLGFLNSKRDFCTDIDGPSTVNPGDPSGSCDPGGVFSYLDNGTTYYIYPTQVLVPLVRAPKWSISAGFAYDVPVGNLGDVEFAGDWQYQSKSNQASNGVPAGLTTGLLNYNGVLVTPIRKASNIFNASVTWRDAEEHYRLSLFMKNITNAHYLQSLTAVAALFNFIQDNNPRTYGVEVQFDF
ncbi:MAG: TonB-dependent receptor [Alphaproteobacteria bacterium]|nr:TonB-dependent receptor [Alphaproteobacteria bacterium]